LTFSQLARGGAFAQTQTALRQAKPQSLRFSHIFYPSPFKSSLKNRLLDLRDKMSAFGGFGGFGQNNNTQQNTGFGGGFGASTNNNNTTGGMDYMEEF